MIRYALRGLRSQWTAWLGTYTILALAAGLVYICLAHRYTVTRPAVVAEAHGLGVAQRELELSGVVVSVFTALVVVPVVAVVGRSGVQALRTTWAQWRLAGALPRQVGATVIVTVSLVAVVSALPGLLLGGVAAQPVSDLLTQMAAQRMGPIAVEHSPLVMLAGIAAVVLVAALGAVGPAYTAATVPAVTALREPCGGRPPMPAGRWAIAVGWLLLCGLHAVGWVVTGPVGIGGMLPTNDGQAAGSALLLGVWAVIAAPAIMPAIQRVVTAPLGRAGATASIARRSAVWRGELGANALGLLTLGFTFGAALLSSLQTSRAAVRAAGDPGAFNLIDSYVLSSIMALFAVWSAVAVIALASRSREREFAMLRCAGSTPDRLLRQVAVEAACHVGTALLTALVPTAVAVLGEAWFLWRAGLAFTPRFAWWQMLAVAAVAYIVLAGTLLLPGRRALRMPVNIALAPE